MRSDDMSHGLVEAVEHPARSGRRQRKLFGAFATLGLTGGLLLAACGGSAEGSDGTTTVDRAPVTPTAQVQTVTPTRIQLDMRDFSFTAPASVPAGWVEISATNSGQEPHHAQFVRLNEGVTMDQLTEALRQGHEAALALVSLAGGVGGIEPGGEQTVYLNLTEGSYVMLCFIAGQDGVPHLAKGMITPITVTPATGPQATAPEADITISLHDFSFQMNGPIPAGEVNLRVDNQGVQPHEWIIFKLDDGQTLADMQAFLAAGEDAAGPPPGTEAGGGQAISSGGSEIITMNLDAGTYVAVCFLPDPETGKSHAELGMVQEFTVS